MTHFSILHRISLSRQQARRIGGKATFTYFFYLILKLKYVVQFLLKMVQ